MRNVGLRTSIIAVLSLSLGLIGCSPAKKNDSGSSSSEAAFCSTVTSYPSSVTITGTAAYNRRSFVDTSPCTTAPGCGLGAVDSTNYPVKYAEVRVLDSAGAIVQCGETDSSGNFSVAVPSGSKTYTLQVNSRAMNSSYIRVSVLNDPTNKQFYSITSSFTANSSQSLGTLVAPATGSVTGGAFNIYDQIFRANEYLRTMTAGCNSTVTGCTPFTAAPKATVYWKLGVNPSTYWGDTTPLSFYLMGTDTFYILGGENGNPDNTDTDHFDNTVIIHEYGHFLEDNYAKSDSPGGNHNGDKIIDPRLAWSEGFANFFGVMVNQHYTNDYFYRDTYGNTNGTTHGYGYKYNIETNSPSRDVASAAGEGNFHEFSIARGLWDVVDRPADSNDSDTDGVNDALGFPQIWTAFETMRSSSYHYRNYGLVMLLQSGLSTPIDVSTVLTAEKQSATLADFATPSAGSSCSSTATISRNPSDTGPFSSSDLFRSNDFYYYYHAGGAITVHTARTTGDQDLDIYIYKDGYTYGQTSDMAGAKNTETGATETFTGSLAAGHYMINVMSYSGSSASNYDLTVNGVKICP